jgi:hypothetical protein
MQPVKFLFKKRSAPMPANQAAPATDPQAGATASSTGDREKQQQGVAVVQQEAVPEVVVQQSAVVDEAAAKWGQWAETVAQEMADIQAPPARMTFELRSYPIDLSGGEGEVSWEDMEDSWESSQVDEASWEAMEASWDEDETCL